MLKGKYGQKLEAELMNALQYLMLGICAIMVTCTPFLLVKAVRQNKKYRFFEIPFSVLMFGYLTVYIGWPNALNTAPPFVRYLVVILLTVWIADWLGVFRWLFSRQKAAPIKHR